MRQFLAAYRLQLQSVRANPDYLLELATIPLFSIVMLSIVKNAGRDDLIVNALLGPVLMGLWGISLGQAGEVIDTDRNAGVLEAVIAAPCRFPVLVAGRVFAVTSLGLLTFIEVGLVATLAFRIRIEVAHPYLFAAGLFITAAAMSGSALLMAAIFSYGRGSRPFQRALSYPFYVLGGVVVPVSFLPEVVQPFTKVIFLSWSSDLLRDSISLASVPDPAARMGVILFLGAAASIGGWWSILKVMRRVRAKGTVSYV